LQHSIKNSYSHLRISKKMFKTGKSHYKLKVGALETLSAAVYCSALKALLKAWSCARSFS